MKKLIILFLPMIFFILNAQARDTERYAIVIGATSGIGRELAKVLSEEKYIVGITGRRTALLKSLQKELPNQSYIQTMDVAQPEKAMHQLEDLIDQMGGLDLIVLNAGVAFVDPDLDWQKEKQMIDVNIVGFTALASEAINYFIKQKRGHFVGISSIGALRGHWYSPVYNATKAYVSLFMDGIRTKVEKMDYPITITDIQPGFIETEMTQGQQGMFWQVSAPEAAQQIYEAIESKSNHAYVAKKWRVVAWAMKFLPDWLYNWFDC